jgi:hypothetical protein
MMLDRCPRCGSTFVHGARFTFRGGQLHERACQACGLMENRLSEDADFGAWLASWRQARSAPEPPPAIAVPGVYRTLLDRTAAYGDARFQLYGPVTDPWPQSLRLLLKPGEPANGTLQVAGAPPEFLPFAAMAADGPGYTEHATGTIGWIVPAPELDFDDFPVGLLSRDAPGTVQQLGDDTRDGIAAVLDILLEEMNMGRGADITGSYTAGVIPQERAIAVMAKALDLGPRTPAYAPDRLRRPAFDPGRYGSRLASFQHEPLPDGVGVLAAGFLRNRPRPPDPDDPADLARAYAEAAALLVRGGAGSALVLVKELFAAAPKCWLATLLPLWQAVYLDLGRPHLLPRLTALAQAFARAECRCGTPHPPPLPAA